MHTKINADHPIGGNTMWAAAAGGPGADIWRIYGKCGDPNANARKKAGSTPLQKALRYPDLAIAEMTSASLLSNDTHPNTPLNADLPPLHIAAERGSFTLVEMLIRLGAEVDQKDQQGRRATQVAAHFGHQWVFELLTHHEQTTMSILCGFMLGAMYCLWPFQQDTTPDELDIKRKVFTHVMPQSIDGAVGLAVLVFVGSASTVLGLDRVSRKLHH